jgi:acetyl-CoA carboxylase biotin carboxylase subunit
MRKLKYSGAGTVEFLYDTERREFYFLEMNARIQVEHPVTEMVTGLDLIAEQIAVAEGQGLRVAQSAVSFTGAAIECRINAEDPARDFAPSPGRVTRADWPQGEGLRVDTHIVEGAMVPPYYDSLMAKIIAHGPDRATALARLRTALEHTHIEGVATNRGFLVQVLADAEFAKGGVDTGYMARHIAARET